MAKSEENQDTFGDSTGPSGLVVPEMFEKEEAAASSMALEVPLGDDGPPGVRQNRGRTSPKAETRR